MNHHYHLKIFHPNRVVHSCILHQVNEHWIFNPDVVEYPHLLFLYYVLSNLLHHIQVLPHLFPMIGFYSSFIPLSFKFDKVWSWESGFSSGCQPWTFYLSFKMLCLCLFCLDLVSRIPSDLVLLALLNPLGLSVWCWGYDHHHLNWH